MCLCARACRKAFQSVEIPTIVTLLLYRSFEYERLPPELRMLQNPAECLRADVSLTDIRVTVHTGGQRHLGIVGMNYMDVGHSK